MDTPNAIFIDILIFSLLGLQFGSFLNVVIFRLPQRLRRLCPNEPAACAQRPKARAFSLAEASHCPVCQTYLSFWELIPVVSFLCQKGRCAHCGSPISWRYPLIEITVAAAWGICAGAWGLSAEALAWSAYVTTLMALAWIAWDTQWLPDVLMLPLIGAGLSLTAFGVIHAANLTQSAWGAVLGFVGLRLSDVIFQRHTGQKGLDPGNSKLLAAMGAWLGWHSLPALVFMALLMAVAARSAQMRFKPTSAPQWLFSQALVASGLIMLWGT